MKISVITICYNTGKYLERAIKSVLKQDYQNWEHIVIDGGSQDATIDILNKYENLIWTSEPDKGQSDAMNKGFDKSSGDIIIYLNADDELNSGLFSVVKNHFQNNPETDILVLDLVSIKFDTITITRPSTSLYHILRCESPRFPLNPVSYAFRRELQTKVGPYPVDNHYAMDYWFLLHAYLYGNVQYEQFIGGKFYFDGNNKSSDWNHSLGHLRKVRNKFLRRFFYKKPAFLFIVKSIRTQVHYLWLKSKNIYLAYNAYL